MSRNTLKEPTLIGHLLEGFFYGNVIRLINIMAPTNRFQYYCGPGLYSGIFAMYLQHHWQAHKTDTGKTKNIIFYAICTLYALFFANFFLGITALCIQMVIEISVRRNHNLFFTYQFCRSSPTRSVCSSLWRPLTT